MNVNKETTSSECLYQLPFIILLVKCTRDGRRPDKDKTCSVIEQILRSFRDDILLKWRAITPVVGQVIGYINDHMLCI